VGTIWAGLLFGPGVGRERHGVPPKGGRPPLREVIHAMRRVGVRHMYYRVIMVIVVWGLWTWRKVDIRIRRRSRGQLLLEHPAERLNQREKYTGKEERALRML